MKKGSAQKNKKSAQMNNPEMAVANLKYEVGQEMGIKPKTKNKKS
jgi:hypothetical protein